VSIHPARPQPVGVDVLDKGYGRTFCETRKGKIAESAKIFSDMKKPLCEKCEIPS
jgi:hypothetical protein